MINDKRKAIALISGGLDSMLAAKMMLEQGIHVEGINFYTGFCVEGHTHAIRKRDSDKSKRNNALWVAEQLGIKLHIIDIIKEYKNVVLNPKHGYGQYLNPCLDCKIFMVRKAKEWIEAHDFDFIVTGEVIGQRPKSQRKVTMPIIASQSGADDRLLRPLCAKNLPATLPERQGWVKRELLGDLSGRNRTPQITMAKQYGLNDFAQPAGGCCFLTHEHYSKKLADLWQARSKRDYEFDDIMLLKIGRHLRPKPNFKLIIGREEGENLFLEGYRKQFTHLRVTSHMSPLVLLDGKPTAEDLQLAARITGRFSQGKECEQVEVQITTCNGESYKLQVAPMTADDIPEAWYI